MTVRLTHNLNTGVTFEKLDRFQCCILLQHLITVFPALVLGSPVLYTLLITYKAMEINNKQNIWQIK